MNAIRAVALVLSSAAVTFALGQLVNVQVLVDEVRVEPGEKYAMAEDGEAVTWNRTVLVCRYLGWTRISRDVLDYSNSGGSGFASCPRFLREALVRW